MRIAIVLLLCCTILAPGIAASKNGKGTNAGAALRSKTVNVFDHTPAAWQPLVAATVAEYNRMLPNKGAPRLVYRSMPELVCEAMLTRVRSIGVCVTDDENAHWGLTQYREKKNRMSHVRVELRTAEWQQFSNYRDWLLCHEFMHATTGAPEVWKGGNNRNSCVWGIVRTAPGKHDRAFARLVYSKQDRSKRKR